MKKVTLVCHACGKVGHIARIGPDPWKPYLCPLNPHHWGKTGLRLESGHCSECGWGNFSYNNGAEFSRDGVRGYRCRNPKCGAIKPERSIPGEL